MGSILSAMNTVTMVGAVPEWTITDRLRKAREMSGLDQTQFADAIGLSRGSISNYERGTTVCKRPVMLAWSMCSGVSMAWLLTGQPENPHPAVPDGGLDECAVRELNPQPADMGTVWTRRVKRSVKRRGNVIPLKRPAPSYVPAIAPDEDEAA